GHVRRARDREPVPRPGRRRGRGDHLLRAVRRGRGHRPFPQAARGHRAGAGEGRQPPGGHTRGDTGGRAGRRGAPVTVDGIDVATAGVRASAVADDGTVVARASAPLPAPVRTAGGRSEQDARAWWPAVESALWQVCAAPEVGTVDAVAVAATSGTIVAVDRHGTPVSPA